VNNRALGIMLIVVGGIWALARTGAIAGPNFLIVLGAAFISGYFITNHRTPLLIAGSVIMAVGIHAQLDPEGYIFFLLLGAAFATVYLVERLVHRDATWALYPAGGLVAFGAFVFLMQEEMYARLLPTLWPIALIAIGLILLLPRR